MNTEPIKGSWEEQKRKLKERFLGLTNSDLNYENGKSEEMLNRIASTPGAIGYLEKSKISERVNVLQIK